MIISKKSYESKFEENASWQINILNKSIAQYGNSLEEQTKLYKYILSTKQFGLMQPLALKVFANIIHKHLKKVVKPNQQGKYTMFTIVCGYNFGKDKWNMNYEKLQNRVKKLLKGYDYIATVALDEFPREKYLGNGTLMSWHVHGIFFKKPSRWHIGKINKRIKQKGHKIIPLKNSSFFQIIDCIYYAFKGPFGGKVLTTDKNGKERFRHVKLPLSSYYENLIKLKDYKIYDFMFAGGKGKKVLNKILMEVGHD